MQSFKRIALLLSIVFLAGSIFSVRSFAMKNDDDQVKIVALGDSITYGWNLDPDKTKPSQKAFPYLIEENASVTNISHPGWTSTQLLNTMKTVPQVIPALQEADVVTLNVGSNDLLQAAGIQQIIAGGVPVVPTPEMQQNVAAASEQLAANLYEIISMIKSQTDAPIVMYNIYNPFGPSTDSFAGSLHLLGEQITQNVNQNVIMPIAYNPGALLADAYTAYSGKQSLYILPGDIHPNENGQLVLANLAAELLASVEPAPNPEYGWVVIDGKQYYLDENGQMVTGAFQMPDGEWYFFDKEGALQTGWVNHNGKWYYYDVKDGHKITGWVRDKSKWYYLDHHTGAMKTGWLQDKGKWYYFEPKSGAMKTGWVQDKNKWYYFESKSGVMKTGWIQDKKNWYYLDTNTGAMETGWLQDKNKWYFLDMKSGAMETGWLQDKNKWYYLDVRSGVMKTGWLLVDKDWYYFYQSGSMAFSTKISGYLLDKNGAWIK